MPSRDLSPPLGPGQAGLCKEAAFAEQIPAQQSGYLCSLWSQAASPGILAPPLFNWVKLGKLLHLSVPQFPQLQNGDHNTSFKQL